MRMISLSQKKNYDLSIERAKIIQQKLLLNRVSSHKIVVQPYGGTQNFSENVESAENLSVSMFVLTKSEF